MKTNLLFASVAVALGLLGCGKSSDVTPAASPGASSPGASSSPKLSAKGPNDPAELRLKWTPGQRQVQRASIATKTLTSGGPLPTPIKNDISMNMESTFTPIGPRPDGYEVEMMMGDVDMSMSMGENQNMAFDTRGEALEGNPAGNMFRSMVGAKLKYFLDASNRVQKVEGWKELLEKIQASSGQAGRNPMTQIMNEEFFKQMGDFGRTLPHRSVQPGESWPSPQEITFGPLGRMLLDLKCTFERWEEHDAQTCARIALTGTIKSAGDTNSPLGKISIEDGKLAGNYWFNPDAGRLVESVLEQNLTMVIEMPGAGPPASAGAPATTGRFSTQMQQKIQVKFSPEGAK